MLSRRCQHFLVAAKRVSVRNASDSTSIPPPKRRGKTLFWLITSVGAGVGGTLTVAYLDADTRKYLEDSIPGAKPILLQLLGEADPNRSLKPYYSQLTSLPDKVKSVWPFGGTKKEEPAKGDEKPFMPPLEVTLPESTKTSVKTVEKSKEKANEEAKKKAGDEQMKKSIAEEQLQKQKANAAIEKKLKEILSTVEEGVKRAVEAKSSAIVALENHTKLLRKAIEDTQAGGNDSQWQWVAQAYEAVEYTSKKEKSEESAARQQLEQLRKLVNEGRSSKATADNQVVLNAAKAANELAFKLDDQATKLSNALNEGKIMTQFKSLIEQGREQFAKELKSILPEVDIREKGKKLSVDELNALIAHAHLRVDQLRRQLAEQQLREEQHLRQALEQQKAENNRFTQEQIEVELGKAKKLAEIDIEIKLSEAKVQFEEELRNQLRRSAAAHSEHLEEVLRVQRDQLSFEHSRQLADALQREREVFQRDVMMAMARLQGIEKALEGRAGLDLENRKAKELWLACQHFQDAITFGRRIGVTKELRRKPLANEVMAIKEAGGNDAFVNTLVNSLPDVALHTGVYTEEDLSKMFQRVKKLCKRVAMIGDTGGSLAQYFLSYVQSFFIFDRAYSQSVGDSVDLSKLDTFRTLSYADHFMSKGNFEDAVRVMQLLEGEPARVAKDWIADVKAHLETRQAAQLALGHAAAISVRSVY